VGRSRWKIENECFNSLKNQGYHMAHNFGHGEKHLSFNMYLSILLAFFMHQILELTYEVYQACQKKFGSKKIVGILSERVLIYLFSPSGIG
jgi:hypothetical protein